MVNKLFYAAFLQHTWDKKSEQLVFKDVCPENPPPPLAFSVSLTPQEEITGPEHLKITYLTRGILLNAVIVVKQRSVFVRSSL